MTAADGAFTGITLLLGGQKSGKSSAAARIATSLAAPVTVIAPAEAADGDAEFADRIARHRRDRHADWTTVESFDVTTALHRTPPGETVIIDALDTWLLHVMDRLDLVDDSDGLTAVDDAAWQAARDEVTALGAAAAARPAATLVIAGVPGWGPIGATALVRRYADLHGLALQHLADVASRTLLVVAGRAVDLDAIDALGGL